MPRSEPPRPSNANQDNLPLTAPRRKLPMPWTVKGYPGGYKILAANGLEVATFEATANRVDFPEGRSLEQAYEEANRIKDAMIEFAGIKARTTPRAA